MNPPDPRSIPPASSVAARWAHRRSFAADRLPAKSALVEAKNAQGARVSVAVVAPKASAIERVCSRITSQLMRDVPLVDELIVVCDDAATLRRVSAEAPQATVVAVGDLIPEVVPVSSRGDALWRSLTVMKGDIAVWIDGDDARFDADVVRRLIAPLIVDQAVAFVRGYDGSSDQFEVEIDDIVYLAGGAPVSEILGRPLLNILFPELGAFRQPLAGPSAGRTQALRQIPFLTGCSVDVAMLIDVFELVGLDGLAQVEIGPRRRGSRRLDELGPEAHAIARTILGRAAQSSRIKLAPAAVAHPFLVSVGKDVKPARIDEIERPPVDVLPPYLAALRTSGPDGHARYAASRRTR